ncbi:MAG: efflux RND transporter periplasmic adaptor subunit [Planctomycetales bacterium]|nr:efflux RND transporter periplasmic adaptor subunit [Planctomycetales bacterium]
MSTVLQPKPATTPSAPVPTPPAKQPPKLLDKPAQKPQTGSPAAPRSRMRMVLITSLVVVVVVGIGWWLTRRDVTTVGGELVYHTVQRGALDLTVTERGNLESQDNVQVLCEVDDVSGDGINGTPIVWIIDNGASVAEGDLIVELDSTPLQERLDAQVLRVEEQRSQLTQAEVQFENQITQNETTLMEAELAVKLAELALKQFGHEEAGTFQIDLQDIELQIQEAEAGQMIEQTNLQGVEQLYKLGYRSVGELNEARLNNLRAQRQLATAISKRRELVEFEYEKKKMELEGALVSSRQALKQVGLDNTAKLAQVQAKLSAAQLQFAKEEELLTRYRDQVARCKIYAPQDGMVAYWVENGRYRRDEIRAGAPVRPRQPILTLPNLKKMQVRTSVHESVLDQIKKGLPATVRVDAFPDMQYTASVNTVAVLPDQGGWLSSDTKVYQTIITIDEDVQLLKPGMTAVVDIHAAHLDDVISVPVQAIEQVGQESWLYVDQKGAPIRRSVTLGMTNSKFVEVRSGIHAGERVVLNPGAINDKSRPQVSAPVAPEAESPETEQSAGDNVG